ncbi:biotin-dependent carboxyltransferase family protein [Leptobacterium sp. I13]|uniref:5-oxoprolinase subunit C family protein n=1 Tax=Leptobacterium meishanense TaxID=3128904 RepID=UPI0030EDB4AE
MVRVINPGFYTTIQDRGRYGYRHFGVPVSGAMDKISFDLANQLLSNDVNAAVMEITMSGPELHFLTHTYITITGALMSPVLNGTNIINNEVYKVNPGDVLTFGKLIKGYRTYLGLKNGFMTENVLESRSYIKCITHSDSIKKGQEIHIATIDSFQKPSGTLKKRRPLLSEELIHVYKGPEYYQLSDKQLEELFSKPFHIANENNRMGYQLKEPIMPHTKTMITSVVLPGTVQLTPSGKLIILMRDGQTTGGYPRILQLSEEAISVLAQKKVNDMISFKLEKY